MLAQYVFFFIYGSVLIRMDTDASSCTVDTLDQFVVKVTIFLCYKWNPKVIPFLRLSLESLHRSFSCKRLHFLP